MKKNVRNALAISGLALAIGASGFTLEASANEGKNSHTQRSHQERIIHTKLKNEKIAVGRRITIGTVTAVGENSITVTKANKSYTINIPAETRILNRNWKDIKLTDIQNGNKVRVFGTISDLTVTAKTIRDISLL